MVPTNEIRLIDSLNGIAYDYRYRNLDTSYMYANKAYRSVHFYKTGKAEASNNLGFYSFMKMDFDKSESHFKEVYKITNNELELLIADIGLMRICQRTALNKEFYDYRNSALRRMKRIREESDLFADRHETLRLNFAFSDFFIVSSIYYYYLQQRQEAMTSIDYVSEDEIKADTNQLLFYHYIKGAASLVDAKTPDERKIREFDELFYTWMVAVESKHLYFEANSMQGISNLMSTPADFQFFEVRRSRALIRLGLPIDSLLPLRLADAALQKFRKYDDLYQISGAYVSMGKYLNAHGRYAEALDTLSKALDCVNKHHLLYYHTKQDTLDKLLPFAEYDSTYVGLSWVSHENVKTVPEWISRIREQLSVSYAGLGMKRASDYNRNIYLDILNYTRQDKELESRYQSLQAGSKQMNIVLSLVIIGLILVIILWWFFNKRSKMRNRVNIERLEQILSLCRDITSFIPMNVPLIQKGIDQLFGTGKLVLTTMDKGEKFTLTASHKLSKDEKALLNVLKPYIEWAVDNEQIVASLSDERLQLEKQRYIYEQHIATNKRRNIVKKACLAIVDGINPYIDRILNEVHKLTSKGYLEDESIKNEKFQYIDELVTTINEYNNILALWIKMKQGDISLNIETFDLDELFELLSKGRRSFEMKHQTLDITPTTDVVKADKALTLFMINTLAENARKYTPEGGEVKVYAKSTDTYVEISVEDNGVGLSAEDVSHIVNEKLYDSRSIGMKDAADTEILKENKGSGFGLMNCKGIIEKYKKTNSLFDVCVFNIESELGKGSRFYFRLPKGVRKVVGVLLLLLFPFGLQSCSQETPLPANDYPNDSLSLAQDSIYDVLLDAASDYANAAYFANVDENYEAALIYADSAIMLLNEHYREYAKTNEPYHYMKLISEDSPAEIFWWNELFDTDYHVILDIRNESAVAFLALKQLEGYNYNNAAYSDLYKLQGKDQNLEGYCRQLERSNNNKTVGIILCFVLLIVFFIGYYILYLRKLLQNRLNLEQVLEINKKVFAASLFGFQPQKEEEALLREENILRGIPRHIVDEAFNSVNELLTIDRMGIAVFNETTHHLEYASYPEQRMPAMVQRCFDTSKYISDSNLQAIPLTVEAANEKQYVGVLFLERREEKDQDTHHLLCELVASYVAIVIFNAVVKLATQYRNIEAAHEEARRASWEDSMLHVQNMVLDNCLSTIKHETIYYPNKIKQIIDRLNTHQLSDKEEQEAVETITELIEYYKGIFTILSSCASRQLEEVTFRRTTITTGELFDSAMKYFKKAIKGKSSEIELVIEPMDAKVIGDINQLRFLFESLIDEALTDSEDGTLRLSAVKDNEFIRFLFTDTRRNKSVAELNQLFYPNLARMTSAEKGELAGTEYLICKQIIRDHDEYAGRRGCRINAEPAEGGGFTVYFTIPAR